MPKNDIKQIELDPARDAWDQQPGESAKRYGQFLIYRDLGQLRTLRQVAEILTVNPVYLRSVAAAHQWRRRVEEWDLSLDTIYQTELRLKRREAARQDAIVLESLLNKVAGRLKTLKPETMEVPELIRALDVVMKHRRALFGDPAVTVALTTPTGEPLPVQLTDFAAMPAERRRAELLALAEDVKRRAEAAAGGTSDA